MTQSQEGDRRAEKNSTSGPPLEDPPFEIENFLEENYALFTVLSIFGAISIYIFGLRGGVSAETPVVIGFVSSQLLLLLSAYAIYKRIFDLMGGIGETLDYVLQPPSKTSLELLVFLVSFTALVISFISVSTEFTGVVSLLLQALALPLGYAVTVGIIQHFDDINDFSVDWEQDLSVPERIKAILILAGIAGIIIATSSHFLNQVNSNVLFGIPETDFLEPVASSFLIGSGLVGGIYALIATFFLMDLVKHLINNAFFWTYSRVFE